jgi:hypothetical protein
MPPTPSAPDTSYAPSLVPATRTISYTPVLLIVLALADAGPGGRLVENSSVGYREASYCFRAVGRPEVIVKRACGKCECADCMPCPAQVRFRTKDAAATQHRPGWIKEVQFSFWSSLPIERQAVRCAVSAASCSRKE